MKFKFTVFITVFIVLTSFNDNDFSLKHPFYEGVLISELILEAGNDSVSANIYVAKDTLHQAVFYYSNIFTPVCEDKLCKPIQICLYWDVSASFLGFNVDGSNPLTKKDHIEFTAGDYYLLYSILNDVDSKLSKIDIHKLTKVKAAYNTTDAVSGATNSVLSSLVVPGAAYTTYALWKLIYSDKICKAISNSNTFKSKMEGISMIGFKEKIERFNEMHSGELSCLLAYADEHKILRKYIVQEMLANSVNTLPPINALLVNNYLRRQNNVDPLFLEKLANNNVLENVFKAMVPE